MADLIWAFRPKLTLTEPQTGTGSPASKDRRDAARAVRRVVDEPGQETCPARVRCMYPLTSQYQHPDEQAERRQRQRAAA